MERSFFVRFAVLSAVIIGGVFLFHMYNTNHFESKEEAYKYIMQDIEAYFINIENYFEVAGRDEELIVDKLMDDGSYQAKNPFNLRTVTFEKYDKLNCAKKFTNKQPKYEELDTSMRNLIKEFNQALKITEDLLQYYVHKDYEKDYFDKARKLHKKLLIQVEVLREAKEKTDALYEQASF